MGAWSYGTTTITWSLTTGQKRVLMTMFWIWMVLVSFRSGGPTGKGGRNQAGDQSPKAKSLIWFTVKRPENKESESFKWNRQGSGKDQIKKKKQRSIPENKHAQKIRMNTNIPQEYSPQSGREQEAGQGLNTQVTGWKKWRKSLGQEHS